jgi:penicillin-binding protein A
MAGILLVLAILGYAGTRISAHWNLPSCHPEAEFREVAKGAPDKRVPEKISREEMPRLLEGFPIGAPLSSRTFQVVRNGSTLAVETTLLPPLQNYLYDLLHHSLTLRAAAVVLKPSTGEVLAFSDYRNGRGNGEGNLCLKADHPAASLFKIVAAAAAIDARGLTPESSVAFKGGRYTLYRSQLKPDNKKQASVKVSLTTAFASSINPVFGKVGIYQLGPSLLAEYADRFFFNRPIPFDLPLQVSPMEVPTDDFAVAEVASGYNKRTFISPLHAAMLAGAVANNGTMMGPRMVRKIEDHEGNLVYGSEPLGLANPVSGETARKMRVLMDETVVAGTCRNAFSRFTQKKVFKELELGAKTGTINDPFDQHRVDWVTVYAIPDSGEEDAISLSVLAVHGEKMGVRSREMASRLVENYFRS